MADAYKGDNFNFRFIKETICFGAYKVNFSMVSSLSVLIIALILFLHFSSIHIFLFERGGVGFSCIFFYV
jgi:hypothetical protein